MGGRCHFVHWLAVPPRPHEHLVAAAVQQEFGHATASITLDTYGHLFPDELEAVAGQLERARAEALASLGTQHGPTVAPIQERAGG
jgi:hypothetical protein